jgi:hypothetical protein
MNPGHDLDVAYRATVYCADTPEGPLTLRIGEVSAALDRLLGARGVASWALITAYNPGSVQTSAAENEARQLELRAAVMQAGHFFCDGAGVGDNWPAEPSLLILGITEAAAAALGRRFGQLAIVVGEHGRPARLLWLRSSGADGGTALRL